VAKRLTALDAQPYDPKASKEQEAFDAPSKYKEEGMKGMSFWTPEQTKELERRKAQEEREEST